MRSYAIGDTTVFYAYFMYNDYDSVTLFLKLIVDNRNSSAKARYLFEKSF